MLAGWIALLAPLAFAPQNEESFPREVPIIDPDVLPEGVVRRIGSLHYRLHHSGLRVTSGVGRDRVFTGAGLGYVTLWDTKSGKPLGRWRVGRTRIETLCASADRSLILSRCMGEDIRLWRTADAKLIHAFPVEKNRSPTLDISDDGKEALIIKGGNTATVWRVGEDQPYRQFKAFEGRAYVNADVKDGRLDTMASDRRVRIWDWRKETCLHDFVLKEVGYDLFAVDLQGERMVCQGPKLGTLSCVSIRAQKVLWTTKFSKAVGYQLIFSPDGKLITTTMGKGLMSLRASDGSFFFNRQFPSFHSIHRFAFSDDGKELYTVGETMLKVLHASNLKDLHPPTGHLGPIGSLEVSGNGSHLVTIGQYDEIKLWNHRTGGEIRNYTRSRKTANNFGAALSVDGTRLFVARPEFSAKVVWLWNLETSRFADMADFKTSRRTCEFGGYGWGRSKHPLSHCVMAPDGRTAVTSSRDDKLVLWDLTTLKPIKMMDKEGHVEFLAIHPEGRFVAAGLGSGGITVRDLETGEIVREMETPPHNACRIAYLPSGKGILSAGKQGPLRLWNAESGKLIWAGEGEAEGIWSLAVSPEGLYGAVGYDTGKVVLWDLDRGVPVRTYEGGHAANVLALRFSAGGRYLFSGGQDTTVVSWKVEGEKGTISRENPLDGLASMDLVEGTAAREELLARGKESIPEVLKRYPPHRVAKAFQNTAVLDRALKDLDGDEIDVRDNATEQLIRMGEDIDSWIRDRLAEEERYSLEVALRLKRIASARAERKSNLGDFSRLRAVALLMEMEQSEESTRALEAYAAGPPGAVSTRTAIRALKARRSLWTLERSGAVDLCNEAADLLSKNKKGAGERLDEASKKDPTYGRIFAIRGNRRFFNLNDKEGALADYAKALELDPDCSIALYGKGMISFYDKDYERCCNYFAASLRKNPLDWKARFSRSVSCILLRRWEEALEDLTLAAHFADWNSETYRLRAEVKLELGDEKGAREDLQEALKRKPKNYKIHETLAWLEFKRKDYKRALEAVNEALQLCLNPEQQHHPLYTRGRIYEEMEDYDQALDNFAKAVKQKKDYAIGHAAMARIRMFKGEYKEARKLLDHALELDPEEAYVYRDMARLAFVEGKPGEAEELCRKGLPFDRYGDATGPLLGWLISHKAGSKEAVDLCRRAVKEDDEKPWFRAALAFALMKTGDRDGALKEAEKGVELAGPQMGRAHLVRGMILSGMGKKKEAAADLEAYLEKAPLAERYPPMEQEARALLK